MGERRRGREFALQMLFQVDLGGESMEAVLATFWTGKKCAEEARRFAEALARGTLAQITEIDAVLREGLEHWRLPRIAAVDRSILRLAVHELMKHPETPPIVVIDEAIELAKRFGGDESGTFINGVLDGVRKRLEEEGARLATEQTALDSE